MQLSELHELYQDNITSSMADVLADRLHVGRESLMRLGLGWIPKGGLWTFPERNADGRIVGIICRRHNGDKFCVKGSKRGLTYAIAPVKDGYDPSRQQWDRVTVENPCPICGRIKFCGIDGNNDPPHFVRCTKQAEGAAYGPDHAGAYIHELVLGAFTPLTRHTAPLAISDKPIVVVEGQTDCATAMDLGFVAVGRPSATGGLTFLADLLQGRQTVAIIGENDAGTGRIGMEQAFETLHNKCPEVIKLLPPEGIKDLRAWVRQRALTRAELLSLIQQGDQMADPDILEDDAVTAVSMLWLGGWK